MKRTPLLFLLTLAAAQAFAAPAARKSAGYDWDDTTVYMTTRMYLQSRSGAPELAVDSVRLKQVQPLLGKPGPFRDRFIGPGTYRDSTDQVGPNMFLRDLQETVLTRRNWQAPAWSDFVEQLSTKDGARRASIITAREHSAKTIHAGLKWLREQGLIRYVPPLENLHAVNRPNATIDGTPLIGSTAQRKLSVQVAILDKLEATAKRGERQTWHFSDDDWNNFEAARLGLAAQLDRWPNVDIVLHYTGGDATHVDATVQLHRP